VTRVANGRVDVIIPPDPDKGRPAQIVNVMADRLVVFDADAQTRRLLARFDELP
jgi:hypothetical protein